MYAEIDFTKTAKERCVHDYINLRIFIRNDDGSLRETRPYNTYEYERLINMQIPIIEEPDTSSCKIPLDPSKVILLSRLRVR